MNRLVTLSVLVLAAASWASAQSVGLNTVNTDPIWNTNVFYTNPPVVASDLRFVNNFGGSGTTCYSGSNSTDSNCYTSTASGAITILNQSASNTFEGLILMATFAGTPTGLNGTLGSEHIALNSGEFNFQSGRVQGGSSNAAMTNQYNSGDFAYIFIRMSDYFGGVNCGSNVNGAGCTLAANSTVTIPYSFVNLPSNVIFDVYGVNPDKSITETNPNSSTAGILGGISTGAAIPEPGTLMLMSGGALALLRLRRRRRVS